jgi:hypothetical protein
MSVINTRVTNGVSMGYLHTVVAGDVSDGEVTIDFQTPYNLVASVMVTNPATADPNQSAPIVDIGDAEISYPAEGQVKLADGDSTFSLAEGQLIHVLAQRRGSLDS